MSKDLFDKDLHEMDIDGHSYRTDKMRYYFSIIAIYYY